MSKMDMDWAAEQIREARVRKDVGGAVMTLLQAWDDVLPLGVEQTEEALNIFKSLAQGHTLLPAESNEVWVECKPGFVKVGDVIRIQHDAFSDAAGRYHNGRVGKVIALRSGDVVFRSTDEKEPFIDGAHYSPGKLEKRVR